MFELSTSKPLKQFEFRIDNFKLEITNATLIVPAAVNWQQLLTKFEIQVHVIIDEVLHYSAPIHLFNDPNSNNPFFELNKVIDNQVFDSVIDLSSVDKVIVKIELIQLRSIIEPFVLKFTKRGIVG
jgi:hypothetical protein